MPDEKRPAPPLARSVQELYQAWRRQPSAESASRFLKGLFGPPVPGVAPQVPDDARLQATVRGVRRQYPGATRGIMMIDRPSTHDLMGVKVAGEYVAPGYISMKPPVQSEFDTGWDQAWLERYGHTHPESLTDEQGVLVHELAHHAGLPDRADRGHARVEANYPPWYRAVKGYVAPLEYDPNVPTAADAESAYQALHDDVNLPLETATPEAQRRASTLSGLMTIRSKKKTKGAK